MNRTNMMRVALAPVAVVVALAAMPFIGVQAAPYELEIIEMISKAITSTTSSM